MARQSGHRMVGNEQVVDLLGSGLGFGGFENAPEALAEPTDGGQVIPSREGRIVTPLAGVLVEKIA